MPKIGARSFIHSCVVCVCVNVMASSRPSLSFASQATLMQANGSRIKLLTWRRRHNLVRGISFFSSFLCWLEEAKIKRTIPMRDRVASVRGNVRKGVGLTMMTLWFVVVVVKLKVRANPQCKLAVGMRAAPQGPNGGKIYLGGNAKMERRRNMYILTSTCTTSSSVPGTIMKQNWRCGMNRTRG